MELLIKIQLKLTERDASSWSGGSIWIKTTTTCNLWFEKLDPMKIVKVPAIPMSAAVPEDKRHRTDLGTKVKNDAALIQVETDNGLTGIGAALGTPPIVAAIVDHELAPECVGEDPLFSERIYETMYYGSRSRPALERGITQADESRRRDLPLGSRPGAAQDMGFGERDELVLVAEDFSKSPVFPVRLGLFDALPGR